VLRREDGFTLVELIVVVIVIGILMSIAIGFHVQAREKAGDAAARTNIRVAQPAVEAYHADHGTYTGMTLPALQAAYSPGVNGIEVVSADDAGYCIRATAASSTWYKQGPDGGITRTACS
jgi:prepilin-type N-terminal cleavage/methylation domain-containing protein